MLGGMTGVDVPEFGAVVGAVEPLAGVADDEPLVPLTESTDSEREVFDRFGNMLGMRNPGDSGFGACGVFATVAGVGVTGEESLGITGDETRRGATTGAAIGVGSVAYACEGGM